MKLVSDVTRDSARPKVTRVRNLLNAYSGQISGLRLIARGGGACCRPRGARRGSRGLEFAAASRLAVERAATPPGDCRPHRQHATGHRFDEQANARGSLEPLLLNPVPRGAFAAGKWLAASVFGWSAQRSSRSC